MRRCKLNVLRFGHEIAGRKRMHKIRSKDLFQRGRIMQIRQPLFSKAMSAAWSCYLAFAHEPPKPPATRQVKFVDSYRHNF